MKSLKEAVSTFLPTVYGNFNIIVWGKERGQEIIILSTPSLDPSRDVLLRIHSECITGDTFSALTCDCGAQKEEALREISKFGNGLFIYHRQEGRNMGLFRKIQAYNLMQDGLDTHEANIKLSGEPDARNYDEILEVLDALLGAKKTKIILLSNNPYKKLVLERDGYQVEMRPLYIGSTVHNSEYMQTKQNKFLHYAVSYRPYVSVTLSQSDFYNEKRIIELINSFELDKSGRNLFIGCPVYPENGDLNNINLVDKLNQFFRSIKNNNNISLVLHINYGEQRKFYRDLKKFLSGLNLRYSLQFRFEKTKPDFDILHDLRGEHMILQVKSSQCDLLDSKKCKDFLQQNNNFLLLDDSFGSGAQSEFVLTKNRVLDIINKEISHIAVAGGYADDKLDEIKKLEDYFKIPISVDAETRLRKNDFLDVDKTRKYLSFFFKQKYP